MGSIQGDDRINFLMKLADARQRQLSQVDNPDQMYDDDRTFREKVDYEIRALDRYVMKNSVKISTERTVDRVKSVFCNLSPGSSSYTRIDYCNPLFLYVRYQERDDHSMIAFARFNVKTGELDYESLHDSSSYSDIAPVVGSYGSEGLILDGRNKQVTAAGKMEGELYIEDGILYDKSGLTVGPFDSLFYANETGYKKFVFDGSCFFLHNSDIYKCTIEDEVAGRYVSVRVGCMGDSSGESTLYLVKKEHIPYGTNIAMSFKPFFLGGRFCYETQAHDDDWYAISQKQTTGKKKRVVIDGETMLPIPALDGFISKIHSSDSYVSYVISNDRIVIVHLRFD